MLGVSSVGLAVGAHGLLLVVVATRGRRLGEGDAGQRRVVGDVEGHDALVTLAGHGQVGDDGSLGVQREVPGQLRVHTRGRDRGRIDRQLVAACGQLLAVLVEAVEDRVVAFLAFDGLNLAGVVVEQGLAGALEGVLAHDLAGLVRVGVGHLRRVTQQAGTRQDARGGLGQRGARHDEVRGVDRAHVIDFLSDEGIQGTQGHLGRGVHEGRGAGMSGARRAVVPLAIEDGRRAPGAVEAHVGDGEVGLTVGAGEGDGAVDERALGSVLIHVRGEGILRGHGHGHGRGSLGGHGHRVRGVGQVNALPRPVLGMLGEQATLDNLGECLATQGVGVCRVRDVRQGHLEGPPVRALTQVGLGAPRVLGARDARVHGRGRGSERVHLAGTHAARRVVGAVVLVDVEQRVGGAHHEGGDDRGLVRLRQAGEGRVVVHALAHEHGNARDLRGRHGCARHGPVGVAQDSRDDVAAGGSDLRLELEVGRDAPRGEVGDRRVGRRELQARVRVGDGDGAGFAGLDGVQERVLLLLRDGHGRHRVGGLDRGHVRVFNRLGVADDEGGGLGGQLGQALNLGLVGHVRARRTVGAAAVFEDDDLRQVAGVLGDELLEGRRVTDARVDEGIGGLGDVEEARHDGVLEAARLAVDDLALPHRQVGQCVLVVDRGDGQGRAVGRGLRERAGVGVGGVGLVLAAVIGVRARVGVTRGGVDRHAGGGEVLVDLRVHGSGLGAHTRVLAEGEVDRVGLDDDRVVKGRQDSVVGDRSILVGGDLGDDDLCVGRGALQVGRVGGGDRGDVGAVRQVLAGLGQYVRVVVRVVEDEGDLLIEVCSGLTMRQLANEGLDIGLAQTHVDAIHGARERLVGGLDARIDDLDDLTITLLGRLVGASHLQGGGVLQGRIHGLDAQCSRVAFDDHGLVVALDERSLHAFGRLDGIQGRGRGLDREAVQRVCVVAHVGDVRTGDHCLDRGFDALLDRLMLGRGRQAKDPLVPRDADRAVFKLDDDRRRGVVCGEALGGGGRVRGPGLVVCPRLRGAGLGVD